MKIINDKYYTPVDLANYCYDRVIEIIGEENISEIVEPSCGEGAFFHHNKLIPHFGYDIDTNLKSDFSQIKICDYLLEDIKYLYGRLIIGNPPYGRCMNLAQKFYKKAVNECDYICFILPIGQLNNTNSLYEFDLIYSEDLGKRFYTDRELHCCLNIYRRPENGLNSKKTNKLKEVCVYRQDSKNYALKPYDIRMCYWGDGTAGKILGEGEKYSAEYKIEVKNSKLKKEIVEYLESFDWKDYLKCIAMRKIQQFHIVEVLKAKFPELR